MKQRSILAVLWLSICLSSSAQTQLGFVKTLGRPSHKGVALSGVSVRVKGGHNAVLSNAQGNFAMPMPGKKPGDAYALQQVQKQGYELRDKAAVGRQYAYSDKVPLTLVMASSSQLSSDKQRIENKAYEVAERGYKAKLAQLEQQKDANRITIDQYRQLLQDLQDKYEKYQSLIDGLAEHYALVDYDALDEQEREINLCIENGDLERADSLLQQLGIQQRAEDIAQRLKAGQRLMDEAWQEQAEVLKRQEKDAEYLYQLYTIALAKFDNDKARFYIETRAELDTTNVEWQMQAGNFISEYLAKYDLALSFYFRALRQSESHDSAGNVINGFLGTTYNNIGYTYFLMSEYAQALNFLNRGLQERIKAKNRDSISVAMSYNNIGNVYYLQGDGGKALDYYSKAMEYVAPTQPSHLSAFATVGHNIVLLLIEAKMYDKALKMNRIVLDLRQKLNGERGLEIANTYNSFGSIYLAMKDDIKALENFQKSLNILISIVGKDHRDVGLSYQNIAASYANHRDHQKALIYYTKAMQVMMNLFGQHHLMTQEALRHMDNTFQVLIRENPNNPKWQEIYEGFKQTYDLK